MKGWLRAAAVPGLLAALAACGASGGVTGTGMGGTGMGGTGMGGTGMMGDSSYHPMRLTCAAPTSLPGSRITVVLGDMGMTRAAGGTAPLGVRMRLLASPTNVPAGQVSVVAENMGWRTHELVVLPLEAGVPSGKRVPGADGKVDESGSLGEASTSCGVGGGDGIKAGAVGWTTVVLRPGRYELICNLANHYADGMHEEIVVT